jgi:hypothetical protein
MLTGAVVMAAILVLPSVAFAVPQTNDPKSMFRPFVTDTGVVQTVTGPNCTNPDNGAGGADVCNASNPFLVPNFGTASGNGQDCETCHQPQLGWSVTPAFLQHQFDESAGTEEQFRVNDTAVDPRVCGAPSADTLQDANAANVVACVSSMPLTSSDQNNKTTQFALFETLSIHRIALKDAGPGTTAGTDDFTITASATSLDGSQIFGPASNDPAVCRATGCGPIVPAGNDSQNPCVVQTGTASLAGCLPTVGVFRRPLVTTNTFFASSVLWDGRQNVCVTLTPAPGTCTATSFKTPPAPDLPGEGAILLANQASGAAKTLPLSANPTVAQDKMAAHFMTGIFTAMINSKGAGNLTDLGANGGPQFLADMAAGKQTPPCTPLVEAATLFSGGGNPPPSCAAPPTGRGFNIFTKFLPANLQTSTTTPQDIFDFCASPARLDQPNPGQIAIACGQNIFDNRPVNDPVVGRTQLPAGQTQFGSNAPPNARCTSCHSAQNIGDNPSPAFILSYTPNGGIAQRPDLFVGGSTLASDDTFCASNPTDPFCQSQTFNLPDFKQRTSMLPLYTLTQSGTNATIQLTDPGQALITHKFANAGGQKPPVLRNLAARAPFFHNGAAMDLDHLVNFYNQNFSIGLTDQEHSDLVAFLAAL